MLIQEGGTKMNKDMNARMSLRTIFDQAALDYDEVRPGYPEELIEDVISISDISKDGRILEIGCGADTVIGVTELNKRDIKFD